MTGAGTLAKTGSWDAKKHCCRVTRILESVETLLVSHAQVNINPQVVFTLRASLQPIYVVFGQIDQAH